MVVDGGLVKGWMVAAVVVLLKRGRNSSSTGSIRT